MDVTGVATGVRTIRPLQYDFSDNAPAAQKFAEPPSMLVPASIQTESIPEEDVQANKRNNGIWINPESFKLLITGQEMMSMTRGEVRDLVARRRAGDAEPPPTELSEDGKRFQTAALTVRDQIRDILSAQGKDLGTDLTFGMFDGKPRISADMGAGRLWTDAPTKEIGDLIVNLWASRGMTAPRTDAPRTDVSV